jgi:hypothetical protein
MIAMDSLRRGLVLKIMRLWRFPVFPRWLSTKKENLKITAPPRSRARPPMTHSQLFPRMDTCPTNSPAPRLSSQTKLITGKAVTPAVDHLFTIRDEKETRLLEKERALAFHHTVVQLLFMLMRARRDIQTAVAFLMTKVKCPDKDDWGKLKQVLKYLNGTKYLRLNLSVDDLGLLKWYVDASHNVHWDCRGHGGAMFTLGKGAMSSYSRKVKLGTRSSTETELVTMDMYMPEMLWSLHFIEVQGYATECVGLYQDNISTKLLIKNRRMSSGNRTKHIKAKFFFITDS